jgi:hypothetical protein
MFFQSYTILSTDIVGEEKARREHVYTKQLQIMENKRNMRANREKERWSELEHKVKREEEKWDERRNLSLEVSRKNNSSVQYDLISQESKTEKDRAYTNYSKDMSHVSFNVFLLIIIVNSRLVQRSYESKSSSREN